MNSNPKRKLALLVVGVTGLTGVGFAASSIASAEGTPNATAGVEAPHASEAPDVNSNVTDTDAAVQDAACAKAGIDTNASNVQFDGVSCSLDAGASDNGGSN